MSVTQVRKSSLNQNDITVISGDLRVPSGQPPLARGVSDRRRKVPIPVEMIEPKQKEPSGGVAAFPKD